jgi:hypothetical protein
VSDVTSGRPAPPPAPAAPPTPQPQQAGQHRVVPTGRREHLTGAAAQPATADRAVFPSRLQVIAELATEHDSVRRALAAEGTAS